MGGVEARAFRVVWRRPETPAGFGPDQACDAEFWAARRPRATGGAQAAAGEVLYWLPLDGGCESLDTGQDARRGLGESDGEVGKGDGEEGAVL